MKEAVYIKSKGPVPKNDNQKAFTDCILLLLITAFIYLPFLGLSGWSGNEPLRVIAAKEMLKTGDWVIPVIHGKTYIAKPPLLNWLIAASGSLFGNIDEWTSRIPSVCAMFMTSIAIYFLTSTWLRREGRLFAAVATLSMAGLMKKAGTAEVDSLFVFFVTLTLLLWIRGYMKQWKPLTVWGLPLFILGVGFLTKGPQSVAYFYITIFAYLLLRKKISFFFTRSHIIGILFFLLVPGVYLFFVLQRISADEYVKIWLVEITSKTEQKSVLLFLKHLFQYPVDMALSFMPWLLCFVPAVIMKDLRGKVRGLFGNEIIVFSLIMVTVNFPIYWILPEARVRYFLPAGPFVALLLAGFFELYLNSAEDNHKIQIIFKNFLKFILLMAFLAVLCIPPVMISMHLRFSLLLVLFIMFLALLGALCIYKIRSNQIKIIPVCIALFTALFWLIYADLSIQHESKKDNDPRKIASEINVLLPEDLNTVYELGFSRLLNNKILEVTSYMKKDVIQLENFSQLKSIGTKKNKIYFIFNTEFPDIVSSDDKKIFYQEIQWEKIYSKKLKKGSGEIVVGYLK